MEDVILIFSLNCWVNPRCKRSEMIMFLYSVSLALEFMPRKLDKVSMRVRQTELSDFQPKNKDS